MQVVRSFGYKFTGGVTKKDLGRLLGDLVSKEGEPAMKALLDIHPDKEVILEQFSSDPECSCNKKTVNATGPSSGDPLLASAIIGGSNNQQYASESRKLASLNGALVISAAIIISTLFFLQVKK